MRRSLITIQLLTIAVVAVLGGSSTARAECLCSQPLPEETRCTETADAPSTPRPAVPLWCERSDDPRCMPANVPAGMASWFVPSPVQSAVPELPIVHRFLRSPSEVSDKTGPHEGVRSRVDRPPA